MIRQTPAVRPGDKPVHAAREQIYEHEDTRDLVGLVEAAAELLRSKGEAALDDFRIADSRWRRGETYVFVLDLQGNMLVHPDPELEGHNALHLEDINGKPIIRGLIAAATAVPDRSDGWYHYEWPVPGGLLPRWKSSYVQLVRAPSGKSYVVGSGMYNDRMERPFVVDAVTKAVGEIEKRGHAAFQLLRDPKGPFIAKDAYVFVIDTNGVELVNPAFPNLEGRQLLELKDAHGKALNREMIDLVKTRGAGWLDYMWPKPGESVATQKSAYVSKANLGEIPVVVGCGVYLANAPKAPRAEKIPAPALMTLVREGAALLQEHGEKGYSELRKHGSKWFRDDTYFFAFNLDGTRAFHATEPETEGRNDIELRDALGRPIVQMILDAAASPTGEGWVHYLYPEPGNIFPAWKSSFVKRVTYPNGKQHVIGCGVYQMQMDAAFIEDVVHRAASLVAERGKDAFGVLRDKAGPFVFMDTYVFVLSPDGTELVNPGHPSLEGKNLYDLRDVKGKALVRDEIAAAMETGAAWVDCYWYKPGDNTPMLKRTFVKKVRSGRDTFIVASGIYVE